MILPVSAQSLLKGNDKLSQTVYAMKNVAPVKAARWDMTSCSCLLALLHPHADWCAVCLSARSTENSIQVIPGGGDYTTPHPTQVAAGHLSGKDLVVLVRFLRFRSEHFLSGAKDPIFCIINSFNLSFLSLLSYCHRHAQRRSPPIPVRIRRAGRLFAGRIWASLSCFRTIRASIPRRRLHSPAHSRTRRATRDFYSLQIAGKG